MFSSSRNAKASSSTSVPVVKVVKKVIKITTKTVQIKKAAPIVPGYIPPPRIVKPTTPIVTSKRWRNTEIERSNSKRGKNLKDDRESSEESSEDEAVIKARSNAIAARIRKAEGYTVVERDVAALKDGNVTCCSAKQLVMNNRAAYIEYFIDPLDLDRTTLDWAHSELPEVQLEYPGDNASESFLLLVPKSAKEEYRPIEDLLAVIKLILDTYLTPAQALATFSHTATSNTSFSAFLSEPPSRSATPTADSPLPSSTFITNQQPLMRTLEKARAKKDGPSFLAAIERFNTGLRTLKTDGTIPANIKLMKGLSEKIWTKIVAQVYERIVGPKIESLNDYAAFSDNVYGELLPKFMSEICQQTNLGPGSVFVDLGSGVGNCVVQAALATGAESYGYENMAPAATLAAAQIIESEARFRLWGVNGGKMHSFEADFCDGSERVSSVLKRADVILVNNEVFSAGLNDRLSLLFLDLRSDVLIVSLKAFASSFKLSAYNLNSPLAIIEQGPEYKYEKKSVSWKDEGGTYYIGRVDRSRVERYLLRESKRDLKRKERAAKFVQKEGIVGNSQLE